MATVFYFPGMFANHIEDSRLKQPVDFENYDPNEYPHFHVFMSIHLGNTIDHSTLEENANIIADIPDDEIRQVTLEQLVDKGLWIEKSNYIV
jgi:hypothetical protein